MPCSTCRATIRSTCCAISMLRPPSTPIAISRNRPSGKPERRAARRNNSTSLKRTAAIAMTLLLSALFAVSASAHGGGDIAGGFAGGFGHPLFGPDHVAAMVAVGLWGAVLAPPAIWLLPVAFPRVMAFGAVPVPRVEVGIAISAMVLELIVAIAVGFRDLPRPCPRR